MGKKVYVGNLPYSIDNAKLEDLFAPFGTVESATVITDRATGQSKGFGFVEMSSEGDAQSAIESLHGSKHDGRTLNVSEARERAPRPGGGGRGDRRY